MISLISKYLFRIIEISVRKQSKQTNDNIELSPNLHIKYKKSIVI